MNRATLPLALFCAVGVAPAAQAAAADWSRTVVATPEGGFRMGNPAAKVKLVEYGSMTCGHCAAFSNSGMASLVGRYVKSGKVSYEYRNFILNGLDVAASLVARCGGPARFFPVAEKLYATQGQWMGRATSLTQAQKDRLAAAPESERLALYADIVGLTELAVQQGVAPAAAKKCLTDQAAVNRLGQMSEAAYAQGVHGTPTFFLNGANIGTLTWATLEPILRQSAG